MQPCQVGVASWLNLEVRHEIPEPVLIEEDRQVVLELNGLNRSDNLRVGVLGSGQDRIVGSTAMRLRGMRLLLSAREDLSEAVLCFQRSITANETDNPSFFVIEPGDAVLLRPGNCSLENVLR